MPPPTPPVKVYELDCGPSRDDDDDASDEVAVADPIRTLIVTETASEAEGASGLPRQKSNTSIATRAWADPGEQCCGTTLHVPGTAKGMRSDAATST